MEKNFGFSLIELLTVIAILAVLSVALWGNYYNQIKKGQDAKRKKDLNQLRTILEDYYNDNNRYPAVLPSCGNSLLPWIKEMPCEPDGSNYVYQTNAEGSFFKIYTSLGNESDPDIEKVGCSSGCGPGNNYNYGTASSNVDL